MITKFGRNLRYDLSQGRIIPLIGVYDVFSATIAASYFDGIFISGFSFAASYYGLPDIGFISWSDIVALVQRVRAVLPDHHIVVDIDDGYVDVETACHVVSLLESIGASGIVMEDQKRPRRCGHFDGKQLLDLDEYLLKLKRVLDTRRDLFVVARTDATDPDDIGTRVQAFAEAGADAILVDGVVDLGLLKRMKSKIDLPFVFNQIAGGKSPLLNLQELRNIGISLVIYSTPCLFAAQAAMEASMKSLKDNDGLLLFKCGGGVGVSDCTDILNKNMERRDRSKCNE